MIAVMYDGTKADIEFEITEKDGYVCTEISKDVDFKKIERIEADFFGEVADTGDPGYMVLPRGEGCNDYSLCFFNRHSDEFEREIRESNMPIFGVKSKERCFLAIVSGMSYDYSLKVVLNNGKYRIFPVFNIYGEQPYENPKVEYFELKGDDADYSGMARLYRQYKVRSFGLKPLSERMKKNNVLDYTVNSVMVRIRCAWKPAPPPVLHQTPENEPDVFTACDFKRAGEIVDALKEQGVEKAEICLVGWNVKGHDGRWPQTFPVCEEAGGEEALRKLIKKAQDAGYQITCHTNSSDQYEIADIYDPENTRLDRFGKPVINSPSWSGGEMFQICPKIGYEQAEKILPKVAELGFKGTHYVDVLGVVHPRRCYHREHYVNSRDSVYYASKIAELSRNLFGGFSSEGAYDFLAPYLDYGLYVGFSRENDGLCDRLIPFWQLVYHGYVLSNPYPETVNPNFKGRDAELKVIEYGGRPSYYFYSKFTGNGFDWMGKTDAVCRTDEQLWESVRKIKNGYDEYQKLVYLQTLFMEKHEEIAENVFKVTYSDGTAVTVDYNKGTYDISKE